MIDALFSKAHLPFELLSIPEPNTGCWLWLRAVSVDGYGYIRRDGETLYAHRYAWIRVSGPIPDGLHVLHKCDQPSCVNPVHLFLGTHLQNMQDMKAKGRMPSHEGEGNPHSRLTSDDVIAIRADSRLQREIAASYGTRQAHISAIKTRRIWKHLL